VDVDFSKKAGPYSRIRQGLVEESTKLENGGQGAPGEMLVAPPVEGFRAPAAPPTPGEAEPAPETPEPEGTEVDRLDVQPDVPTPGEVVPRGAPPPPPQPQPQPPEE
jgi:general secretion pathway protein D